MGEYAFTSFCLDDEEWDGNGPGIALFANALQVWALAQDHRVTIAEAATAFRTPTLMIEAAVEWHPWMFEFGGLIEHDGE
jgi:hypothetical protein